MVTSINTKVLPTDEFNTVGQAIDELNKFHADSPDTPSDNEAARRASMAYDIKKQFLGQDKVADKMLGDYMLLDEEEKFVMRMTPENQAKYNPRTTLNPITHPEVLLALRIHQVQLALDNSGILQMPNMEAEDQAELLSSLNNLDIRQKLGERFPESMTTKTLLSTKTALVGMDNSLG